MPTSQASANKSAVMTFRLTPDFAHQIDRLAAASGETRSVALRLALREGLRALRGRR